MKIVSPTFLFGENERSFMVFVLLHGPNYRSTAICPNCGAFLRYSQRDQNIYHEIRCPDCKRDFKVSTKEE